MLDCRIRHGRFEVIDSSRNLSRNFCIDTVDDRGERSLIAPRGSFAFFRFLRLFVRHAHFTLNGFRIAIPPDRNITREKRGAALNDIDIHDTGSDIDESSRILLRDRVVDRMHVFDREGIHIHDHRKQPGPFDEFCQLINLVFLGCDQNDRHLALSIAGGRRRRQYAEVDVHLINIEGDVLLCSKPHLPLQLLIRHRRQANLFNDDRMPRNRHGNLLHLDVRFFE